MLKLFCSSLCHRIKMTVGFDPRRFREFLRLDQGNSKLGLASVYGFGQENDAETLLLHRFINCVFEGEMHKNSIAALSDRGKVLVSGTVRRWGWRSFVISYYNDWLNMHGQINVLLAHLTASTKCTALSRVFIYIIQNQTQLGLNFILPHLFFFRLCNLFCPLLFSLPFGYYSSLKKNPLAL